MSLSSSPWDDVLLAPEEQLAWREIEQALREADRIRKCAALRWLRRAGWGLVFGLGLLYLPIDFPAELVRWGPAFRTQGER